MTRTPLQLRKPALGLTLAAASLITLSACSSGYADTDTGSTATFQENAYEDMLITQISKDGEVAQFELIDADADENDDDIKLFEDVLDGVLTEEDNPGIHGDLKSGTLSEDGSSILWEDGETSTVEISDDMLVIDDDTAQNINSQASIDLQERQDYTR